MIPLNKRNFKKKSFKWKKDVAESVHKARHTMMQVMILKATTRGAFWVDVKLFQMLETFYLSNFNKYFFNYPYFQLPQNVVHHIS